MMYGGYGRGWRHRNVYYATGIPGSGRGRCFWPGMWPDPRLYEEREYDPAIPARYPFGYEYPPLTEEEELEMLEEDEQAIRAELNEITDRIKELKGSAKKSANKKSKGGD